MLRTDFNKFGVVLNGIIYRDASNCSTKLLGSNITYIVRDPSNNWHYNFIDSCRTPIDKPVKFTIYPQNYSKPEEGFYDYFYYNSPKVETLRENIED